MKNRLAKKHARAYMDGRKQYPIVREVCSYDTDGNWYIRWRAVMPYRVYLWARWYAYRAGWDGCHWDSPDILDLYFPDEDERWWP